MDKLNMQSINLTEENIKKIEKLFPNVITEIKDKDGNLKKGIDFEKLKLELSEDISDDPESYDFTWVGKKASIIEANTPIRKTLRPCVEESKDWENTGNLYIEGDNLEALKLLQESYLNSIKMIYIDPPYNTGNDFIYRDNFTIDKDEYDEQLGLYDEEENRLFQNNESNGRFHSDWCSMMYPRLKLAQYLLSEDGVIFISIDDREVDNIKKICDEIFGEENLLGILKWKRKKQPSFLHGHVASVVEYIFVYSKEKKLVEKLSIEKRSDSNTRIDNAANKMVERIISQGIRVKLDNSINVIKKGIYTNKSMQTEYCNDVFIRDGRTLNEVIVKGKFRNDQITINKFISNDVLFITKNFGLRRDLLSEEKERRKAIVDLLLDWGDNQDSDKELKQLFQNKKPYDYPKPLLLLKNLVSSVNTNNEIILDFFSGSATTAHAVMQLNAEDGGNRKFIMVNLPEPCDEKSEAYKAGYKNICEIGKERIRRAGEKIKSEIEKNNTQLKIGEEPRKVPDIGFRVLKVDSTNMKDVYYSADQYNQDMLEGLESNIKEDRIDLDLLYGVMLDWGIQLSLNHKIEQIDGINIHTVDEGSLVACFADRVSEKVVREIAKRKPLRVVFKDSSFKSSPEKINVEEIFKLYAPGTSVKVI